MKTKTTFSRSLAMPARHVAQRFALFLLVASAAGLMVLGKFEVVAVERARIAIADSVAPVLDVMSRPVEAVSNAAENVRGAIHMYHENARLERENLRLRHWEQVARRLAAENAALRGQLGVVPEPEPRYVSARVIGDSSGPFVRTLLINAGRGDGAVKGAAAITSAGLVGRVVQVGERSSRLLLVTDLNSRVPVRIEGRGTRAILAGDNSARARLTFLPGGSKVEIGDRVVTSGHGGVFQPGIAVGQVVAIEDDVPRVMPFIDWDRLDFVRLVERPLGDVARLDGEPGADGGRLLR